MNRRLLTLAGLAGVLALGACSDDDDGPSGPTPAADPIATIAVENGLDELVAALSYVDAELDAGLVELFQNGTDEYTVLAPTDAAFEELYALLTTVLGTEVDDITDVPAPVVYDVLLYHVLEGSNGSSAVVPQSGERTLTPLLGETFAVRADGTIRDGLTGSRDDAVIVTADIEASNGVVHVIDAVIVPPSVVEAVTGSAVRGAPAPGTEPIAAIAIDGGYSELVAALAYVDAELGAGLVDLFMSGTDQYTVFAPTNAAFEELYTLLTGVLGQDIDEITDVPASVVYDVLRYHVVEGRRAANSVVPPRRERTITTLLGERFGVSTDATIRDGLSGLRDDAAIVTPNLSASNGIIHVIDAVLVPPSVVAALTD